MPRKKNEEIEEVEQVTDSHWAVVGVKVMLLLLERESFTADSYWELCKLEGMPEELIAKSSGSQFKKAQSNSWIRKKGRTYRLSTRTSQPLPLWCPTRKMKEAVKESKKAR
jgi:hypothetical protein